MNVIPFIINVLEFALGGIIVFFVAWIVIKEHLRQQVDVNRIEQKIENLKHTLPLRLQAYERVILLLERINPSNLLLRLHVPGMTAHEMQAIITADIRAEYQHNISQQIYVNPTTWNVVKKIKEDTISIVNSAGSALSENATSGDLSRSILIHLSSLETDNPYEVALDIVKQDVQSIF